MRVELSLRKIMRKVKSPDPKTRFEALTELQKYKDEEDLQVQIEVLIDCVKTATYKFPEPVDQWDNPSYHLIDFVCRFPMPQIMEALMKHFDAIDSFAKDRAIEFLLETENQTAFHFLEGKIVELIDSGEFKRIGELDLYPVLTRNILDKTLEHIHTPQYKFMFYSLILSIHESGLEKSYKKEKIESILLDDYQKVLKEYSEFDQDYTTKFVYTAWKDSYFIVRHKMTLLIALMEFYFSSDTEKEILHALQFKDPILKTHALMICVKKNLPYDPTILDELANDMESAEELYWSLLNENCEHLYPIKEGLQPHLAKARFFNVVVNGKENVYPDKIEVVDYLDTENVYQQEVRFYLMNFEADGVEFVGWAGGFSVDPEDPEGTIWDETHTNFDQFQLINIEDYKKKLLEDQKNARKIIDNHIFYESSPKLGVGFWFSIAVIVPSAIRFSYNIMDQAIWMIISIILITVGLSLNQVQRNKKKKVIITGEQLSIKKGNTESNIALQEIGRVEHNKKFVSVYNHNEELKIQFPIKWVHYYLFTQQLKLSTNHLKNKPLIQ